MLDKRVAIVTGAAQGLGLAIAEELLDQGKAVALVDLNEKELKLQEERLSAPGREVICLVANVGIQQEIESVVQTVEQCFGRIDILINNAGIRRETAIEEITFEEWQQVLTVNLGGTFFFSQAVLKIMKKQQWGRIINISSFGGQYGTLTSGAHYNASKAGQLALTKVFARSLAAEGITVNAVAPAAIHTPEMDKMDAAKLEQMKKGIPVGRFGTSAEVAQMVAYLASEEAGYITGSTFDINGGLLMR